MGKKLFIISLGGSLINSAEIDIIFLKKFKTLILQEISKGSRFILVTGGGRPAREYINALNKLSTVSNSDLDWMGIFTTRFNAQLIRLMFGKIANPKIAEDPNIKFDFKEKILVAGGWQPGRSTDDVAVRLANTYGATAVINLSNIDYAYTKDPKKFPDAKKIESINWKDFRKIVGNRWDPGKNLPFDPTAAKNAEKLKLKVIIANGKNLSNLKNILTDKTFQGTIIN
jgi:uridylate kinase